jgi:hypothetical protein
MSADRVYAAILRLYPRPFRDEYGDEMAATFRELRDSRRSTPLRFWTFILADAARTAGRERLEGMRWLGTALFGLLVTIAAAQAAMCSYRYFYHPYFEGTAIPPIPYGVALGLVLGVSIAVAQRAMFPSAERRAVDWALASAVALPIAIFFCATAVEHAMNAVNPVAAEPHLFALNIFVLGLARPGNWTDVATQFSAMAASALIVRTFMLMPLERRHAH